jgi:hypothetical protein
MGVGVRGEGTGKEENDHPTIAMLMLLSKIFF